MDAHADCLTDTQPDSDAQPFANHNEHPNAHAPPVPYGETECDPEPDGLPHAKLDLPTDNRRTDAEADSHTDQHALAQSQVVDP